MKQLPAASMTKIELPGGDQIQEAELDLGLKGKRAFVAGSSRGLGYATALLLSKEGCSVAINGRDDSRVKPPQRRQYLGNLVTVWSAWPAT